MTRDERQEITVNKFKKAGYNGGLLAFTGSGKTISAIKIAKSGGFKNIIVVVPTIPLKHQWSKLLIEFGITGQVLVINTASSHKYECDLLILDEVHKLLAETFIKVFETIKYDNLIWLTATLERSDNRHKLIIEKYPIVDTITMQECIDNNWTSEFNIILIEVELTEEERKKYDIIDRQLNDIAHKIDPYNPLGQAEKDISYFGIKRRPELWRININTGKIYYYPVLISEHTNLREDNLRLPNNRDIQKFYNKAVTATKYFSLIRERKSITHNASNKIEITLELIDIFSDTKTLVFSQDISFIQKLAQHIPNVLSYHTKQSAKINKTNLQKFIEGEQLLLSVKALNEGIDIPDIETAIVVSSTSSKSDATQIIGRTVRKKQNKIANIIYLVVPNTQDEKRITNALKTKDFLKLKIEDL